MIIFALMKKIISSVFLLCLLLAIVVGFGVYSFYLKPLNTENQTIYIQKADDYTQLVKKLKAKDLIYNEKAFHLLAKKMNLPNKVYAGKFIIKKETNTLGLIRLLRGNQQSAVKVVINNVNFKADLVSKLAQQLAIDSLQFFNLLNDENYLKQKGLNKDNIMCQIVPNTYAMYWSISEKALLEKLIAEKNKFWTKERIKKAKKYNLSPDEVFILASIVEKEYKFADERQRIAGVYLNRLKINMPLQADPTCKFAWGDLSLKRVLNIHTQNPHPYNTYYIAGLPPGPICLPETSTINAVLNAEEHNYLYFCAHSDLNGRHHFNKTLTEHNKAARKYQKALNKLRIYQ